MLLSLVRVSGHSMEPAIHDGQMILASNISFVFRQPKAGDVVLLQINNKKFLKRIKNIREDKYYLTGDNKNDSLDSRNLGWIERKQILGKVLFVP